MRWAAPPSVVPLAAELRHPHLQPHLQPHLHRPARSMGFHRICRHHVSPACLLCHRHPHHRSLPCHPRLNLLQRRRRAKRTKRATGTRMERLRQGLHRDPRAALLLDPIPTAARRHGTRRAAFKPAPIFSTPKLAPKSMRWAAPPSVVPLAAEPMQFHPLRPRACRQSCHRRFRPPRRPRRPAATGAWRAAFPPLWRYRPAVRCPPLRPAATHRPRLGASSSFVRGAPTPRAARASATATCWERWRASLVA